MTPKYSNSCSIIYIFLEPDCYSDHGVCAGLGEITVVFVDDPFADVGIYPGVCFIFLVEEVVDGDVDADLLDKLRFENVADTQVADEIGIDGTVFARGVVDILAADKLGVETCAELFPVEIEHAVGDDVWRKGDVGCP